MYDFHGKSEFTPNEPPPNKPDSLWDRRAEPQLPLRGNLRVGPSSPHRLGAPHPGSPKGEVLVAGNVKEQGIFHRSSSGYEKSIEMRSDEIRQVTPILHHRSSVGPSTESPGRFVPGVHEREVRLVRDSRHNKVRLHPRRTPRFPNVSHIPASAN